MRIVMAVLAAVAILLFSTAVGVMSMSPPDYSLARGALIGSVGALAILTVCFQTGADSLPIKIGLGVVAAGLLIWGFPEAMRYIANRESVSLHPQSAAPFVKNQQLRRGEAGMKAAPAISYFADYAVTGKRLRVFLEYQSAEYGVELHPMRVQLAELNNFVKNGQLQFAVIAREEGANGRPIYKWGTYEKTDPSLFIGNYRARIIFVDDDGREQKYYFLITGGTTWDTSVPGGSLIPYPDFVSAEYLGFAERWEALDAQH